MRFNIILDTDSYKPSHSFMMPKEVHGEFSYLASRSKNETVMLATLQMWIEKTLTQPVETWMIDEAEAFLAAHGEPFDREAWEYIVEKYDGYLPVTIRAVPEGLPLNSGNVLVTIECDDPKVYWLPSHLETSIERSVWYGSTVASNDYKIKKVIAKFLDETVGNRDLLPFMLHDFGSRGVTCEEQAQYGGAAHLFNFMGSDTISGVRAANFYYDSPMSAFSVPASQHSVAQAYGRDTAGAKAYLKAVLDKFAKPGKIVSIVLDTYDFWREVELLCTDFHDFIVKSEAKVVFRPDSGNPLEIIPRLLKLQDMAFGHVKNPMGYRKINNVGIIWGDGIDSLMITKILSLMKSLGYAADNIVFGSGGALLQRMERDTYKFAQKQSAILVDREWQPTYKDPVTDAGKRSMGGKLTVVRSRLTGEYLTLPKSSTLNEEFEDVMVTVYDKGRIMNRITLDEIRRNCAI